MASIPKNELNLFEYVVMKKVPAPSEMIKGSLIFKTLMETINQLIEQHELITAENVYKMSKNRQVLVLYMHFVNELDR